MLRRSLKDIIHMKIVPGSLERLSWRDFGNGLSMTRLAREGKREMVLYRIQADADRNAFLKHEHLGGEFYIVLKGKIADEMGEYEEGELVFLDPKSVHAPHAQGETVVLVVWPEGVRIVD